MIRLFSPDARLVVVAGAFSFFVNLLALVAPIYTMQVYDRVLASRSLETLALLGAITLAALAAFAGLDSIRMQLLARIAARFEGAAIVSTLRRTIGASGSANAAAYRHGLRDVRAIRNVLSSAAMVALLDIPWSPVFVLLIGLFHPLLGAITVAGVATMLVLAWIDHRSSRRAVEKAGESSRTLSELADEALANAEAVRALGMQPEIDRRVHQANASATDASLSAGRASSRVLAFSRWFRQALQVVMLGLGAYLVIRRQASPGVMIASTLLLSRAMTPIESAIAGWRLMIEGSSAYRRLRGWLDAESPVEPMPLPTPRGELAVERAVFATDPKAPILKAVSFSLEPGALMGLIGPSGAGKSTLGRLLVAVLQPTAGNVRLDGAALHQWHQDRLGRHVGYLPQDVQLFDGTVAENIARLGDPGALHEGVVKAARLAGLHELILQLPRGYDTPIGPRGCRLSSGQRQLVGLARAFFGEPALIVLDEPNANLDADGEEKLLAALRTLKARRATVVVITHRPALLCDADKVLVLRAGAVAQFGNREDVLGRVARVTPLPLHAPRHLERVNG